MSYEILVRTHLIFGTGALAAFWLQMAIRKGGVLHRRVGQTYLWAMIGVACTAVPMTVILTLRQQWTVALLLGFLLWITASAGVGAWMAARWRNRHLVLQRTVGRFLSWVLLLISLSLVVLTRWGGLLPLGLGAFGLWAAVSDLRLADDAWVWRSWKARHLEGMIGTGIAVHVAFLIFGLRGLLSVAGLSFSNLYFLLAFALPVTAGMVAGSLLSARHAPEPESGTGEQGAATVPDELAGEPSA